MGFCGNIIVIVIYGFGKKFKDRKYRCYVLCLAIINLATCLTLIPAEIIQHRIYFVFVKTELCKVKCFFNIFGASSASVCLLIVAMDRYILVCHPVVCDKMGELRLSGNNTVTEYETSGESYSQKSGWIKHSNELIFQVMIFK